MTLPVGTRLGVYEIVRAIGSGGMGEVYRARDTKLARDVAIKVLPPSVAGDTQRLERFEREARTASALSHPNIVTIYEIGEVDGSPFIAMELVEGKTVRDFVLGGPVAPKKLVSIAAQTADGLAKAHAAGIVHRDLKPENLMVTRDGFVKILDFGLAKLVPVGFETSRGIERPTVTRGTQAGTVLGTVGYMSPEQASGSPADFRSDQFSLGSILYEMATGHRAFERPTDAQTLSAIIEAEPEPLATAAPKLPTNLSWVVERCLAKDPEDRYGSTKDLARDLAALRDRSSGSISGIEPPAARRARLPRIVLPALVTFGVALLAFLAGQRLQQRRDRDALPPQQATLTFRRGFLSGARFAPDGQTIVYSAAWDGKSSEIFTTRVGSVDSRPRGIEGATLLSVSSRGDMALLMGCDSAMCLGALARAPLAGGAPREILGDVTSADWSPDGNDLAVIRTRELEYPIGKVVYRTAPIGFLSHVRVSPDGSRVAFLDHPRRESDRGLVTVVDRAGKKKVLTTEWARLGPILWNPTGDEVFFTPWRRRETRGVRLSGQTRNASWIPALDDVSREGRFLGTGSLSDDYRGNVRALGPASPEECNLAWLGGSVVSDLSSDGKSLLLYEETRHTDRPGEELFTSFLRPTDGSDAMRLGEGRALALSPDKQWALVAREHPEPHLVLLPTVAGEPRRLEGGGLLYRRARFFNDGKRIFFNADRELGDVQGYVQSIEGGPPKPIEAPNALPLIVSPDGADILAAGEGGLELLRIDGGDPIRRVPGKPPGVPLRWGFDSRTIYTWEETDRLILYRVDLATGRSERLKELAPPDRTGFLRYGSRPVGMGLSITPDGLYYAYSYFTDQNRLTLTDVGPNWWR